ncbi:MAG: 4a-hydroxytetrahydrobiopterin dehydratase [Magnetococcales bacterium]|nr:4a-hydroxytetrahydrobiopterin dehydratase [Magnetococcales bacterium]
MNDLHEHHCIPCKEMASPFTIDQAREWLLKVPEWEISPAGDAIQRVFEFKNFYQTMAFVNAVAWVAHREDHHPNLEVGYKHLKLSYSTHFIGGLSENDFICAAKVNALLATTPP